MSSKSRKKPLINRELTPTEQKILHMVVHDYLTVNKIANRRKCSKQAVYQHLDSLKKKGYLKKGFQTLEKSQPTLTKKIRLHGQELNINILYKDTRYNQILSKSNLIMVEGNTIKLNRNSIEIYCGQSFYADTPNKAFFKCLGYLNKLISRMENDLKIELIKPRKQNIKMVNAHFSEIDNEIAKEYHMTGDKLRLYATEDGKLWGTIDNSFNLHEFECLHPSTSKQDMNRVVSVMNDIRDKETLKLSELSVLISDTVKQVNEISYGLKSIVDLLKPRVPQEIERLDRPEYIG